MVVLHFLVVSIHVGLLTGYSSALGCEDNPLGMKDYIIPENKITASSGRAGNQARLNTNGPSWCTMGNDSNPYLQIDLGTPHIICAVSTQGDHQADHWVKTFQLSSSDNEMNFLNYSEYGEDNGQTFYGNVDGSGIVKQILYKRIIARYLRILPKIHHGAVCMRAEIYGMRIRSENVALNKVAKVSYGEKNRGASLAVDGNRNAASSFSCATFGSQNYNHWWGVSLGTSIEVSEISVYTNSLPDHGSSSWTTRFEIIIGHKAWYPVHRSNAKCGGSYAIIHGNPNITIVCQPPIIGSFVFVKLLEKTQLTLCEVEVYGRENHGYGKRATQSSTYYAAEAAVDGNFQTCTSTKYYDYNKWWMLDFGHRLSIVEVKIVVYGLHIKEFVISVGDSQSNGGIFNAPCNTTYGRNTQGKKHIYCRSPMMGRYLTITEKTRSKYYLQICEVEVYTQTQALVCSTKTIVASNRPWTPSSTHPYLQIQLNKIHYVCAVATKANYSNKYRLEWTAGSHWKFKTLTGNLDSFGIIKHVFPRPLTASIIQLVPLGTNAKDVWVEIYGVAKEKDLRKPSHIGYKTLHPVQGSYVDLVCRGDRGQSIKWYYNDTDITRYSNGTVSSGQTLISKLRVNYTSADDIYEKYPCGDVIMQKRNCTSLEYICQVDHGSYRTHQGRGRVTTVLGVPSSPVIDKIHKFTRSALVVIKQTRRRADEGNIMKYSIEINEKKNGETTLSTYNITGMEPHTNYIVKVMASSKIGDSEWSKPKTFSTLQAEPSVAPANIKAEKIKDGEFNIFWEKIPKKQANGEIVAYEINCKPVNLLRRKRRSSESSSRSFAKNATKSPHLVNVIHNVTYNISIRGYTMAGPGPASRPITINREKSPTDSQDPKGPLASSSSSSLLIIIAAVVPILIIIMIAMIVTIFWWRRHKEQEEKVMRVHYAAHEEHRAERAVMDVNEDKDGRDQDHLTPPVVVDSNLPNRETKKSGVPVGQFSDYMRKVRRDQYETLAKEFQRVGDGQQFPCMVAKKPVNKNKNRYANIVPYDHCRVVLGKIKEGEDSDYINASYIRGFHGSKTSYIASQGPMPNTIADFWRMIWQEKSSVIVMLTGLVEAQKTKCEKYWPENRETYLDISVKLQKTEAFSDYSIRTFFLTKANTTEQRYVFQYHFTAWPDKGVPQHATQLLAFRKRLVSDTAMGSPWVVHCSAGVGRTGAFLAIDAMLRQAQEKKTIDVFSYVKTMRENRSYMVQTQEQYVFVHMAILEYLTCGITEIRAQQLKEEMNKLANVNKNSLSGYEMEFKHLSEVCPPVQDDEITTGNKPCNNRKNRFPHIVPLDKARVILQVDVEDDGANYINASYANGYRQRDAYILTQAPLDNTIDDFWKMIYDKRLGTIVMLNNLQEGNVNYQSYWPQEGSFEFGDITVEIIQEEEKNSVTSRTFTLTHKSDGPDRAHEVRHYQHTDWKDGSVPNSEKSVLDLIEKLQRSQQQSGNKSMVVQCSDGVGRSGTLCTILSLLDRVKTEQMVDVFQAVKTLRISRPGAVETAVQYRFCFQLVISYLDSFSDYSNFNG